MSQDQPADTDEMIRVVVTITRNGHIKTDTYAKPEAMNGAGMLVVIGALDSAKQYFRGGGP